MLINLTWEIFGIILGIPKYYVVYEMNKMLIDVSFDENDAKRKIKDDELGFELDDDGKWSRSL